jgi:uncharacterized protein YkwD
LDETDAGAMLFGVGLLGLASYYGYKHLVSEQQPINVITSSVNNNIPLCGNDRQDMLSYLNAVRKQNNLNELNWNEQLYNVAQYWANECVKYNIVEHYYNGSSPSIRAYQFGINVNDTIIEVMSKTYSPQKAMINFMNSPSHRKGCLMSDLYIAGVGVANTQDGMKLFVIDML